MNPRYQGHPLVSTLVLCGVGGEKRLSSINKLIKAVTTWGNNIYTIFCASCIMQPVSVSLSYEEFHYLPQKRPLGSSQMALYSNTTLTGLPARNPEIIALMKIQFHPRIVVPPHKIGSSVLGYECCD